MSPARRPQDARSSGRRDPAPAPPEQTDLAALAASFARIRDGLVSLGVLTPEEATTIAARLHGATNHDDDSRP